jgi:hypothetical protein
MYRTSTRSFIAYLGCSKRLNILWYTCCAPRSAVYRELLNREKEYLRQGRKKVAGCTDPTVDKAKLVYDEEAMVRF